MRNTTLEQVEIDATLCVIVARCVEEMAPVFNPPDAADPGYVELEQTLSGISLDEQELSPAAVKALMAIPQVNAIINRMMEREG